MHRFAIVSALLVFASSTAPAQSNWDKTYNTSGKPSVQMELDDASVRSRSCGGCRAVQVHVDWRGQDPSHWRISEMQAGGAVVVRFGMARQLTRGGRRPAL